MRDPTRVYILYFVRRSDHGRSDSSVCKCKIQNLWNSHLLGLDSEIGLNATRFTYIFRQKIFRHAKEYVRVRSSDWKNLPIVWTYPYLILQVNSTKASTEWLGVAEIDARLWNKKIDPQKWNIAPTATSTLNLCLLNSFRCIFLLSHLSVSLNSCLFWAKHDSILINFSEFSIFKGFFCQPMAANHFLQTSVQILWPKKREISVICMLYDDKCGHFVNDSV